MHADDMILISVDDHIAEPADMFESHVPAKYRELIPRVETDAQVSSSGGTATRRGATSASTPWPANPARCTT